MGWESGSDYWSDRWHEDRQGEPMEEPEEQIAQAARQRALKDAIRVLRNEYERQITETQSRIGFMGMQQAHTAGVRQGALLHAIDLVSELIEPGQHS